MHDDGQLADDLENADVILVGVVSRTSKTPTLDLSRQIAASRPPIFRWCRACRRRPALEAVRRPLVVGLFASPERIVQIRQNRLLGLKRPPRRRPVHRSPGGRRGDRILAAAVQQA